MQALQLPALFIFQADEKKQAQACFATQPAPSFLKAFLKNAYQNDMSRQFIQNDIQSFSLPPVPWA